MARGSSVRSGSPPDPDALRRNRAGDKPWRVLPAEGRKGKSPAWPLTQRTRRELTIWNRLWQMPQAVVWEELLQERQVAQYVRRFAEAEERGSAVNLTTVVRQMEEALGLSLPGLNANRWRIEPSSVSAGVKQSRAPRKSSRDRLTVVRDEG